MKLRAYLLLLLVIFSGLAIVLLTVFWHKLYILHIQENGVATDIFRPSIRALAPFYGIESINKDYQVLILGIFILILGLIMYKSICRIHYQKYWVVLIALIALFAGSESLQRLLGSVAHIQTFSNDLSFFDDISDVLSSYTSKQHLLDVHGQHYPPPVI